jgi:DNA-binding response OmpR family regulator
MGQQILIAEDEMRMARIMREWFTNEGFQVEVAESGTDGLSAMRKNPADLMILDVMMPGMDGLTMLRTLREEGCTVPAIVLTARGELSDKLEGFKAGAEDYLTKPFEVEELDARVHVLLREKWKSVPKSDNLIVINDISLSRDRHVLRSANSGKEIRLSQKEYTLLEYFMENPDRILTGEQITIRIWGYDTEGRR